MDSKNLFAVFGNPILHSRSPQIFNSAFKEMNYGGYYTRIRPYRAEDIVEIIRTIPLAGANITAPYKEEVLPLLDVVSVDAQAIGAINTIVNSDGRLIGYNTDHYGVVQSLKEKNIVLNKSKCLVIGAGGAAKAAVYGLKRQGADVFICNRTLSRAQAIADNFNCIAIGFKEVENQTSFDIVISTVPSHIPIDFLMNIKIKNYLDASYHSSINLIITKDMGANVAGGERWLLHQAAEAFRLIVGEIPLISAMEKGLKEPRCKNNTISLEYPKSLRSNIIENRADIVISTQGEINLSFNEILDEEIRKAFPS